MKALRRREEALLHRRQLLLQHSQACRLELGAVLHDMQPGFAVADRALQVAGWVRRHGPLLAGVAALALALKGPRTLLGIASQAWTAWQGYRNLRNRFDSLLRRMGTD